MDIADGVVQPAAGGAQENQIADAGLHGGAESKLRIGLILFRLVLFEGYVLYLLVFLQKLAPYRIEITDNGIRSDIQLFYSRQAAVHGDHHVKCLVL